MNTQIQVQLIFHQTLMEEEIWSLEVFFDEFSWCFIVTGND